MYPFNVIFHLKPFPFDLETKRSDLGKKKDDMSVSSLLVVYRSKTEQGQMLKVELLAANTFGTGLSCRKYSLSKFLEIAKMNFLYSGMIFFYG